MLESQVELRTSELRMANDNLFLTLENLKQTQSSLIKAEKQKETEIIRSRISQDIHDDISSELTKISWMSELLKSREEKNAEFLSHELLAKITASSRNTISKLQEIIWAVKPENDNLESFFLYSRNFIANFLEHTTIKYEMSFPISTEGLSINPQLKRNLFLVLKESLNNAVKYSSAKEIQVTFVLEGTSYCFSICDDGVGIEPDVIRGGGNGLLNMRSRIEVSGGNFRVETGKNKGTKIVVQGELF
jgi:signal transduction histidine kinase